LQIWELMSRPPLEKVVSGEVLSFSAVEQNAFIDAANAEKARQQNAVGGRGYANTTPGIVDIQNISSQAVDMFDYMVIEDFIFQPLDNLTEYINNASFKANVYDEDNDAHDDAAIVVLLEPMAAGTVGKAMIVGATQMRVNVTDEAHKFAMIKSGTTILQSAFGGPIRIITKETGTGNKWSYGSFPIENPTQQFIVKSVLNKDSVTCRTWDGTAEGTKDIEIALPYTLRRTPFDGGSRLGIDYTYQTNQKRTGSIGDDEQKQILMPFIEADDIVYAMKGISGGVGVVSQETGKALEWIMTIFDGRYWAEDDSEDE